MDSRLCVTSRQTFTKLTAALTHHTQSPDIFFLSELMEWLEDGFVFQEKGMLYHVHAEVSGKPSDPELLKDSGPMWSLDFDETDTSSMPAACLGHHSEDPTLW